MTILFGLAGLITLIAFPQVNLFPMFLPFLTDRCADWFATIEAAAVHRVPE